MRHIPWKQKNKKQKVVSSLASILLIGAISVIAYAAINYFFHLNFTVDNTRGVKIGGAWTGENVSGTEVLPGSSFTLTQTITNESTEDVYVFVRIDTEGNAYRISEVDESWTVVKEADGVILLAYGSTSAMVEIGPDVEIEFGGLLTLDVSNKEFSELNDSALDFSVHACGIAKSQCEGKIGALAVYEVYEDNGGE